MPVHNVYKPLGWSSLDVITKFREYYPEFRHSSITYAGRLDPMAEGVVILLSNEERFDKPLFQKLNKKYQASILLGVSSDSYDCLGFISPGSQPPVVDHTSIKSFMAGTHNLPFPPYSAYRIQGKPLHYWAQNNKIDEIHVPIKTMQVLAIEDIRIRTESLVRIKTEACDRISVVHGDFRQAEVLRYWRLLNPLYDLLRIDCTLTVTSGTYIRALAHEMGSVLGCGGLLHSLKRVSVGSYNICDAIHLPEME